MESKVSLSYSTKYLLEYLTFTKQHSLIRLYEADVAFSVKGAAKIPTYQISRLEVRDVRSSDYSTLDQLIAYDIYVMLKYCLGFSWNSYRILGVTHIIDDRFKLDIIFK